MPIEPKSRIIDDISALLLYVAMRDARGHISTYAVAKTFWSLSDPHWAVQSTGAEWLLSLLDASQADAICHARI
jgi:hypothetical protein